MNFIVIVEFGSMRASNRITEKVGGDLKKAIELCDYWYKEYKKAYKTVVARVVCNVYLRNGEENNGSQQD